MCGKTSHLDHVRMLHTKARVMGFVPEFHCQLELAPTSAISCSVDGLALNYGFRD